MPDIDDQSPFFGPMTMADGYRFLIALKRWEETLDPATRSPINNPDMLESMQKLQVELNQLLRVVQKRNEAAEATRCLYCGEPFERKTAAQRFCCTNHRTYYAKGRQKPA